MTEEFMFNAPRYYAFDNPEVHLDEEKSDSFFEVDHEAADEGDKKNVIMYEDISFEAVEVNENEENNMEFYSPMTKTPETGKLRRSSSIGCIPYQITKDIKNEVNALSKNLDVGLKIEEPKKKSTKYGSVENLSKNSSTRGSNPKLSRFSSKENLNRLAQPKHKFSSMENLNKKPYVSMAEAMNRFQRGTPERFRSRPNRPLSGALKLTVPQSPALMTKTRHRPNTAMSAQEKEQLEFEEAQKFKIRARPVNKKALHGPIKAQVPMERKPVTIPQPFNLTAPQRKVAESSDPKGQKATEFHSKPIPSAIHNKPQLPSVERKKVTIPETPNFMKKYKPPVRAKSLEKLNKETAPKPVKLTRTEPVPFSFEKRDEQMQKEKEKRIQQVLEEEKKAREFHARPLPKKIFGSPCQRSRSSSSNSIKSHKSAENLSSSEQQPQTFKARPPTVLYKEPFKPKHENKPLTEICPFELYSDRRARERREFEEKLKKKQELLDKLKEQEEAERLRQEEEEIKLLRKQAEKKAQPIKKFKPIQIMPSNKVTEPISPNFMTSRLRQANKENMH